MSLALDIPLKEELLEEYTRYGSTLSSVARKYKTSHPTIRKWLKSYEIDLKSHLQASQEANKRDMASVPSKEILEEYEVETIIPWRSVAEIELFEYVYSLTPDIIWSPSDKSLISPFELDMVCHEKKLAIEYCGLYWHSEFTGEKERDYHAKKQLMCRDAGYTLLTVFESDNINLVKKLIKVKMGLCDRVYARECNVVVLESHEAKSFNDTNHIHGHCGGSVHLGLIYRGKLLQVLTMGKPRFSSNYEWECVRATSSDTIVVGGTSKLFSYFVREYKPRSIITFADLRYGSGSVYERCGFKRVKDTGSNYWYFNRKDQSRLYSRVAFQKHKLKELSGYDQTLTEWNIMKLSGYDRIWDCGNAKYIYDINIS